MEHEITLDLRISKLNCACAEWAGYFGYKGGRGYFVSGAMSYYARKKDFAWGIG